MTFYPATCYYHLIKGARNLKSMEESLLIVSELAATIIENINVLLIYF